MKDHGWRPKRAIPGLVGMTTLLLLLAGAGPGWSRDGYYHGGYYHGGSATLILSNRTDEAYRFWIDEQNREVHLGQAASHCPSSGRGRWRGYTLSPHETLRLYVYPKRHRLRWVASGESISGKMYAGVETHFVLTQGGPTGCDLVAEVWRQGSRRSTEVLASRLFGGAHPIHPPHGAPGDGHGARSVSIRGPEPGQPDEIFQPHTGHPRIVLMTPDPRRPEGSVERPAHAGGEIRVRTPMPGYGPVTIQPLVAGHPTIEILPGRDDTCEEEHLLRLGTPTRRQGPVHLLAPMPGHPAIILYPPDPSRPEGYVQWDRGSRNASNPIRIHGPERGRDDLVIQPMVPGAPKTIVEPPVHGRSRTLLEYRGSRHGPSGRGGYHGRGGHGTPDPRSPVRSVPGSGPYVLPTRTVTVRLGGGGTENRSVDPRLRMAIGLADLVLRKAMD